jgi:hypothetical protein
MDCLDKDFEKGVKDRQYTATTVCGPGELDIVKTGYKAFIEFSKSNSFCGKDHALLNEGKFFLFKFWYVSFVKRVHVHSITFKSLSGIKSLRKYGIFI